MNSQNDLNRIKIVLAENKKTAKWLAEQLEVAQSSVSRWNSNRSQPDLYTLSRIAQLLNVNVKELLNDTELK